MYIRNNQVLIHRSYWSQHVRINCTTYLELYKIINGYKKLSNKSSLPYNPYQDLVLNLDCFHPEIKC